MIPSTRDQAGPGAGRREGGRGRGGGSWGRLCFWGPEKEPELVRGAGHMTANALSGARDVAELCALQIASQ